MEQMKHQEIFIKNILPSGSQMYVVFRKIKAINKGSPHIQMFNRKEDWEFKSKETSCSSSFDEKGLMVLSHKRGYFITYSVAAAKANVLLSKSAVASLKPIKVDVTWKRYTPKYGVSKAYFNNRESWCTEAVCKEARLQHHFRRVNVIEKYTIPNSLLNINQTPSKYVIVLLVEQQWHLQI